MEAEREGKKGKQEGTGRGDSIHDLTLASYLPDSALDARIHARSRG